MPTLAEKYKDVAVPQNAQGMVAKFKIGESLLGVYRGSAPQAYKGKTFLSHAFDWIESDCDVVLGKESVEIEAGDRIHVSGTVLDGFFTQEKIGRKFLLTYRGKGNGQQGGQSNLFDISLMP